VRDGRGFTLVEAVVALALVATVGVSVSTALVASRAMAVHDRDQAIGRVAAQARLSTLASLAFHSIAGADGSSVAVTDTSTDVSGDPPGPGGTGLAESPADALWHDTTGYVDYLDAAGRDLGRRAGARERAAYVRRWAIGRQGGGAGEVALIAVLVAPVPAAARAAAGDPTRVIDWPGVVLLRGARMRRAS
jgi:type II secretory pathway pseudopilin PulG